MKIRTELASPACTASPVDHWYAIDDDTYDGPESAMGYGETEQEAIADLKEKLGDHCEFCGREITWCEDAEIDDDTERICFDCDRQRDDARRDEAMGL